MKSFFTVLILFCSAASFARLIIPDNSSVKKYFSFFVSLLCLLILLSPLGGIITAVKNARFDFDYSAGTSVNAQDSVSLVIKDALCDKFGLSSRDVSVSFDGANLFITLPKRLSAFESDVTDFSISNFGFIPKISY